MYSLTTLKLDKCLITFELQVTIFKYSSLLEGSVFVSICVFPSRTRHN